MQCPRCNGLLKIPKPYNQVDDDPTCYSCGRSYPHLKPDPPHGIDTNGAKPRRGMQETIHYTGSIEALKTTTCIVNYKAHPSPSVGYPLVEVSCPWCGEVVEVKNWYTRSNTRPKRIVSLTRYESSWRNNPIKEPPSHLGTGRTTVKCTTGHIFILKITNEGTCSWE